MVELKILYYLLNIDNYNKYRHRLKVKEPIHIKQLYSILDDCINKYQRTLSKEEYESIVYSTDPSLVEYFEDIELGDDVLEDLIKIAVDRAWAYEHALLAIDVSEGKKDIDCIIQHNSLLEEIRDREEIKFVTDNLEEIYQDTVKTPGLRWRLDSLNKSIGSLRKGNFVVFFSRPEGGKTTFCASEITHMAEQATSPILWLNNEQEGNQVKLRCYQGALGVTLEQLYNDRQTMYNMYMKRTKGNIKLFDNADIHRKQVEQLCKQFEPALIVFDQIDKIKGFQDDREDLRLGAIYIWARELAKKYCPVIGICQADATGENKRWLDMSNMSNSKTSKAAEADVIIGMGYVHDEGLQHIRYFNIIKNKLMGDEDSDPSMRHAKIEVIIKPEVARYMEIG